MDKKLIKLAATFIATGAIIMLMAFAACNLHPMQPPPAQVIKCGTLPDRIQRGEVQADHIYVNVADTFLDPVPVNQARCIVLP